MEVVALNEQLREEFAGVARHLLPIRREEIARVAAAAAGAKVSASEKVSGPQKEVSKDGQRRVAPSRTSAQEPATEPQMEAEKASAGTLKPGEVLPLRTQQYALRVRAILDGITMYKYKSRDQFGADVAALLEFADSKDQKLLLTQLVEQQRELAASQASNTAKRAANPARAKRQKVNGIRVHSAAIPGVQKRGMWAINLNLGGNTSTVSVWNSRERALADYCDETRAELRSMPNGMEVLQNLSADLARKVSTLDAEVLQDAVKQVKLRLPMSRHHDVASLTAAMSPPATHAPLLAASQAAQVVAAPAATPASKDKDAKSSRKRELLVDTSANGTPAPSTNKELTPASAMPQLVEQRTPTDSVNRKGFLRLRRLIQMRLCSHLEGQEIIVRLEPPDESESWVPVGRLEKPGRVYAYASKKKIKFPDYVLATLKRSVAACEHLYLVKTRENIDSHLLVCDCFSDAFRKELCREDFREPTERYMNSNGRV